MSANMGLRPTKACIKAMREAFPKDATIELIFMDDLYRSIPRGLKGQVEQVDDMGTIHTHWESGSSLGAVWNADVVKNVATGICSNAFWDDYRPNATV